MKIVRLVSKRMPRRNIARERNERGFQLFLENLKGVVSLCAGDEVYWTEDFIGETTQRLQDSYTTLALIESQMNDPVLRTNFFHSYCKLFLTGTTNYFLLLVLRNSFSLALGITFQGIVNLFFGLQYLAGLRLRGTCSSTFPLDFSAIRAIFVVSSFGAVL